MIAIAQSNTMRLRFVQDRADVFLDVSIAKTPEAWIGLYDLLDEMKRKGLIPDGYKYVNRLSTLSAVLRKALPTIQAYLASKT